MKWITPPEINEDSYIIKDSVRKLTELGVKKTGLSSFPEGTLILSSRTPIGKVAIALHWEKYFQHIIEKYNKIYKEEMPKVTPHERPADRDDDGQWGALYLSISN